MNTHTIIHSVPISQSYYREESLKSLDLPLVGITHGEPILQSASNITSIVGWAESCYMPGSVYGSIGTDDFFFVLASNYSGPNSFDVFIYLSSYDTSPRPWKLISCAFGVPGDKFGYRVAYGTFDEKAMEVMLYDKSNRLVRKFDVRAAYDTLRSKTN
jgi:hypothetical protein